MVVRGRVHLTTSTEIVALDGRTGAVVWRTPLPVSGNGSLATDGRDLLLMSPEYEGSDEGRVTAYDLATGRGDPADPVPRGRVRPADDARPAHGLVGLHAGGVLLGDLAAHPSASIAAISSSVSVKPRTSRLVAIRSGVVDFGMTTTSCWTCQRSTTWAGVTPCASAASVRPPRPGRCA